MVLKFLRRDLDEIFAYKTVKVVQVIERQLGLTFLGILAVIFVYLVVFVFYLKEGYYRVDQASGPVMHAFQGSGWSVVGKEVRYWDAIDLLYPPLEAEAMFITTRLLVTEQQRQQECLNPDRPCSTSSECPIRQRKLEKGKCSGKGYCLELMWCPAHTHNRAVSKAHVFMIEGLEKSLITFKPSMIFPQAEHDVFFYPQYQLPKPMTMGEFLAKANVQYKDVQNGGGLFTVEWTWNCYMHLDDACGTPEMVVTRLDQNANDQNKGFRFYRGSHYKKNNVDARDLFEHNGIRIFFISHGVGKTLSTILVVLQISSCLALITLARLVTDFIMQYVLKYRARYRLFKIMDTPDFSDLRARLVSTTGDDRTYEEKIQKYLGRSQHR